MSNIKTQFLGSSDNVFKASLDFMTNPTAENGDRLTLNYANKRAGEVGTATAYVKQTLNSAAAVSPTAPAAAPATTAATMTTTKPSSGGFGTGVKG